jgi:hypothetical protein
LKNVYDLSIKVFIIGLFCNVGRNLDRFNRVYFNNSKEAAKNLNVCMSIGACLNLGVEKILLYYYFGRKRFIPV